MLLIISPSKTLDFSKSSLTPNFTIPEFLPEAEILVAELRKYSTTRLSKLMNISSKLAQQNYDRFQSWSLPITSENAKQALLAFKGDVYDGINVETYSKNDFRFAQEHLRILSGLYGILKPLDLIQPYRLEMGIPFNTRRWKNLYDYWVTKITDKINESLNDEILINLASNEYFKAVKKSNIQARIITPVFKDYKNGSYKFLSFYGKKTRGSMASFIIRNKLTDPEEMKLFDVDGYYFNDEMSSADEWAFTRG